MKSKWFVGIALMVAWAFIVALFIVGFNWLGQDSGTDPTSMPVAGGLLPAGSSAPNATAALSASEVARHNSAQSCWTIVDGEVYDVTSYIGRHPGGAAAIRQMCGVDATAALRGQHGMSKDGTLGKFYLGALAAADTSPASSARTMIPQAEDSDREDREWEDD